MSDLIGQRIAAVEEAMQATRLVFERRNLDKDQTALFMLAAFLAAAAGDGTNAHATRTLADVSDSVSHLTRMHETQVRRQA